ncbi:hypothetical protein [Hymenobacter ruricola]|uniref:Nuclear transport factor 2 family protein n=1 Tax=Hymenobacter ruricola TaxID=2791023 RepID=A0ABS0I152_9BACT|nr:hypothetical protein [Hymenobacter ruricola]MBF9220666.1 hypothetical protein [Hymenobacter ruricola]
MSATVAATASDDEIIGLIDQWVSLLEQERYEDAHAFLETDPSWSAEVLKEIIEAYGDEANNRVTLRNNGTALDGAGKVEAARQRKEVSWADADRGDVWYDLNINGLGSDLTATFNLEKRGERIHLILQDIHVM